jgi:hypothetical protein
MLLVGLLARRAELPATEIRWPIGQLASILAAVLFGLVVGTYAALSPPVADIGYATVAFRRWLNRFYGPMLTDCPTGFVGGDCSDSVGLPPAG